LPEASAVAIRTRAERRPVARPGRRSPPLHWWARPHTLTFFLLVPLYVACAALPHEMFVLWRHSRNFMSSNMFEIGAAGLIGFALAAWIATGVSARNRPSSEAGAGWMIDRTIYRGLTYLILGICLAAYALFLAPVVRNPTMVLNLLGQTSYASTMREMLIRMPGITSFVNLGPLYVTLLFLQPQLTGSPLSRLDKIVLAGFLFLVLVRVLLWSERLAFLEVVVPIAIIRFARMPRYRLLLALLPFVGILVLTLYFGVTEYFRSWTYYSGTGVSFADFVLSRLLGYYATALNNGALLFLSYSPPFVPHHTAEWFVHLPFLPALGLDPPAAHRSLVAGATLQNPEFNNNSGLFAPMNDLGPAAGIGVWIVLGLVTGRLCRGFTDGKLLPMLLYPTWIIGIYELLRIFYWGATRYFPVLATIPLVYFILRYAAGRRRQRTSRRIRIRVVHPEFPIPQR